LQHYGLRALNWLFPETRSVIRGAGDLASGVAYRLFKAGFPVVMLERSAPLVVRRTVSFGNAIFEGGTFTVQDIRSKVVDSFEQVSHVLEGFQIPILVDPDGQFIRETMPPVVIDVRMQKTPLDTQITDAPFVVGFGPGYIAGNHAHAVIETQRGHDLGRVIWDGSASPDTGTPGTIAGYSSERVLRAPADGYVVPALGIEIGVQVAEGQLIATVDDLPVHAKFPGVLRGLIHPAVEVWAGLKIGDLDPRGDVSHCYTISDKALALGGGALEAILSAPILRPHLQKSKEQADASL
jgi:xanthine dehydrogenase accessory factor